MARPTGIPGLGLTFTAQRTTSISRDTSEKPKNQANSSSLDGTDKMSYKDKDSQAVGLSTKAVHSDKADTVSQANAENSPRKWP